MAGIEHLVEKLGLFKMTYTDLIEFAKHPRHQDDPINLAIDHELSRRTIKPMTVTLT
jgi:hypothetical protein